MLIYHKDSRTELEPTNTWKSKSANGTAFMGILLQVFQRMDSHKGTAGKKEQFSERLSILTRFTHTDWQYTLWLQDQIVHQYFTSFEELIPTFCTWMWWSKGALANKLRFTPVCHHIHLMASYLRIMWTSLIYQQTSCEGFSSLNQRNQLLPSMHDNRIHIKSLHQGGFWPY